MEYSLTPVTLVPTQTVSAPNQVVPAGSDMSHRTHRGYKGRFVSWADMLAFWDNVYQERNCLYKEEEKNFVRCGWCGCTSYQRVFLLQWNFKRLSTNHLAFMTESGCGPISVWSTWALSLASSASPSERFEASVICSSPGSLIFETLVKSEHNSMVSDEEETG